MTILELIPVTNVIKELKSIVFVNNFLFVIDVKNEF